MRFLRRIINVFRNEVYIINGNKVKRKFIPFIKGLNLAQLSQKIFHKNQILLSQETLLV